MGRGGAQRLDLSRRLNGLAIQKQAKYLNFLHHSAGSRLVCMAWGQRASHCISLAVSAVLFTPDHFMNYCPSDIISGQYH